MWKLVIEDDEGKRTVVPITRDDYTIGRQEGNSIRLTERNVSRDHAKLHKTNGVANEKPVFTLEDLTSYNGVYVNGLRVSEQQELAHGDLIQIGDYRIVLQDEQAAVGESDAEASANTEDLKATMPDVVPAVSPLRATNATFLEKPNRLVVLAGPNPGEEFPLVGDRLTVGRAEDATISINHNSVSRLHCEVHSLGEGRFEIVDKGSSNGVRVNGADLRRGIIEAGDVIELGDVKFKFVGEGQLFRPGAGEGQQLAAISQRAATMVMQVKPGRSSVVTAVLVAVMLAAGVGAAMFFIKKEHGLDPPPADPGVSVTADTTGADAATLADARRMADIGDIEGAHQKAMQLTPTSTLINSDDFKYIDFKWASMTLLKADPEPDAKTKYALLSAVASDPYIDPSLKKTAEARMAAVDLSSRSAASASSAKASSSATTSPPVRGGTSHATAPPSPPDSPSTPQARVVAHASASGPSLNDLYLSANPADVQKARSILEPRVFGKHPTPDDIRMLKAICKQQHDTQCLSSLPQL